MQSKNLSVLITFLKCIFKSILLYKSLLFFSRSRYAANLIECAELKGDAVDTFGKGVADVDAPHRLDESAHLAKILTNRNVIFDRRRNMHK